MLLRIAAGAGKFLRVPRILARISPNLPIKLFAAKFTSTNFLSRTLTKNMKIFFGGRTCWRKKSVFNQSVSLITQIERRRQSTCAQTFRDFARIFDKSNFCGCTFTLCTPSSYITDITYSGVCLFYTFLSAIFNLYTFVSIKL